MFSEKLKTISNVDLSGSRSSQRFEYQVACVFLTFLTLYKKQMIFLSFWISLTILLLLKIIIQIMK